MVTMTLTNTTPEALGAIGPEIRGQVLQTVTPDGSRLNYRLWSSPEAGAAAVYLHGIAGHSLWFSAAASRLAEAGIVVYGPDRRGSGLNTHLADGQLKSYQTVLADVRHFVELARAEHPGRRVFLIAGCWGAKAGTVFVAREPNAVDGLALVAPALSVRVTLPPRHLLGVALSLLLRPSRRFPIPLRPEQYTENERFRAFVAADPQRLLSATARFFFETNRLDRLSAAAPSSIRVPVLVLLGARDAIVRLEGMQAWYERLAAADKMLRIYPDFAHILEFEEQWEVYLADLLAWLKRQTGSEGRAVASGAEPA
jgi:alpha-beta hydrolase superfamily lysophospholipase